MELLRIQRDLFLTSTQFIHEYAVSRVRQKDGIGMTMRSKEVLIVDDNPADVELTIHVLRANHLANAIHVAEDGKEALDFIFCRGEYAFRSTEDRPCVILLDLKLPKVDGMSVLEAIRLDERTRTIPVVILTSSKEPCDLARVYQSGANGFVQKPVDFARFQIAVKEIGLFWLLVNEPPPFNPFPISASPV